MPTLEKAVENKRKADARAAEKELKTKRAKEDAETAKITKKFAEHTETCFKTFIKANKAKVSISGRYIEFQYTGKTYRIVLGSEFRTASNEGEDDGYHLTYQLIGWPRHWPVQHVADFYNEVSAYSPHKIGCDCGCLGWGITTPIDLYPKIVRVISERKEEA